MFVSFVSLLFLLQWMLICICYNLMVCGKNRTECTIANEYVNWIWHKDPSVVE